MTSFFQPTKQSNPVFEEFQLKSAPLNRTVSSEIPGVLVPRKSSGILNPQIQRKEFQDSSIPRIPGNAIQSRGKSNEESLIPRPSSSRFLNRGKVYFMVFYVGISETYEMDGQSGQLPNQFLQE